MSPRATAAIVAEVIRESEPLRVANLPPVQADYVRRLGAASDLTTDAAIEAAVPSAAEVDASEALDEIAASARGRRGGATHT